MTFTIYNAVDISFSEESLFLSFTCLTVWTCKFFLYIGMSLLFSAKLFSVIKWASNSSRLLLLLWSCFHYTCFPSSWLLTMFVILTVSCTPVHLSTLSWLHRQTWLEHTGQLALVQGSREENNMENIWTTWAVPDILVASVYHYVTSIIHIISLVIVV